MFIEYSATIQHDPFNLLFENKKYSRTTLVWKDDGPFQKYLQDYNRLGYIPELQALDLLNILFLCVVVDTQFKTKNVHV